MSKHRKNFVVRKLEVAFDPGTLRKIRQAYESPKNTMVQLKYMPFRDRHGHEMRISESTFIKTASRLGWVRDFTAIGRDFRAGHIIGDICERHGISRIPLRELAEMLNWKRDEKAYTQALSKLCQSRSTQFEPVVPFPEKYLESKGIGWPSDTGRVRWWEWEIRERLRPVNELVSRYRQL